MKHNPQIQSDERVRLAKERIRRGGYSSRELAVAVCRAVPDALAIDEQSRSHGSPGSDPIDTPGDPPEGNTE